MKPFDNTDDLAAARRCLETYGGDPDRWPEELRMRFGDIAKSAALEMECADAEAIDELLDAATAPATPHDLKNRIEASFQFAGNGGERLFDFSVLTAWLRPLPAGAFAAMTALGFAAAAVVDSTMAPPPEYQAYAYLQDSGLAAFDEEAGTEWVAE